MNDFTQLRIVRLRTRIGELKENPNLMDSEEFRRKVILCLYDIHEELATQATAIKTLQALMPDRYL